MTYVRIAGITFLLTGIMGCGPAPPAADGTGGTDEWTGPAVPLGQGGVWSAARVGPDGVPAEVTVVLSEAALQGLPSQSNATSRCFDKDANGTVTKHECLGDYEVRLELPRGLTENASNPFRWIMVNWNAEGHLPPAPAPGVAPPPAPYLEPHFDFHFYTVDAARVDAIRTGPCGEFVDCRDFETGSQPVPAGYLPPGYIDVGAVVPAMGNHLIDSLSPELADPPQPFTRTFIYGAFGGELMFWEPMITRAFIQNTADACFDIRQPERFAQPAAYPTRYCVRHDPTAREYRISLERFETAM